MKLERMIGILSILLQKERVTAPYLAAKFEVSRRTPEVFRTFSKKTGVPEGYRNPPGER